MNPEEQMPKNEAPAGLRTGETPECLLAAALAAARAEFPRIEKARAAKVETRTGGSYGYEYADLADIMAAVVPALCKHGLVVTQPTLVEASGQIVLVTRLRHVGGGVEESRWPIVFPPTATPQQVGSAITYARRYQYVSILGVQPSREDDDGAAASDQPGPTDRGLHAPTGNGRHGVPSARPSTAGPPTAAQSGKIKALMRQHGLTADYLKALSGEMFERDRPETAEQASALIDRIETAARGVQSEPGEGG